MTQWEVVHCSNRHYCRVVYGLRPYIADYKEQALLACIVQNWCARYVHHSVFKPTHIQVCSTRCLGHRLNLDEPEGHLLLQTCDHIDDLIESFDFDELWSDFGIVADIVVSPFPCSSCRYTILTTGTASHSQMTSLVLIYASSYRQTCCIN